MTAADLNSAVGHFQVGDNVWMRSPIFEEDSPRLHQNQPPDGSRPLMRRYVTRLP